MGIKNEPSFIRDFVSVKNFGVKGNGITDDTLAIQKVLNNHKHVFFPDTPGSYYKISNTLTITSEHVLTGAGIGSSRFVMTDPTKWAFACDPVVSSYFNNGESAGGGLFDVDVRARYGLRIGNINLANAPTYNYAGATEFFAANNPVQQFKVERCNFISDIDYAAAYNYIAASTNWNTLVVPTNADLFTRGCGVLYANNYRGAVRDCQIKFYGIGVYLFGADIAEVSNCRIANNLRNIHVQGQFASGSQVDIHHNDLLANYRVGGVYITSGHNAVRANYFENTGGATNSTINSYVIDAGQTTNLSENRFDDYGSTKTSGALVTFAGVGGATAWGNRVADNRPAGAGTLAPLGVETANWKPALTALFCQHGLVSVGDNDSSFPRLRHPLVSYDLDGCNPLEWAPTRKHRDVGYADISGGGIMTYKFAQDTAGMWYLNTSPFENGINLKPADHQLTKTLTYNVFIRGKCLVASPFNVFTLIKWTTAAGVTSTVFSGNLVFTNNTTVQEVMQAVTIPAASAGYFTVFSVITGLNSYGIRIVEA